MVEGTWRHEGALQPQQVGFWFCTPPEHDDASVNERPSARQIWIVRKEGLKNKNADFVVCSQTSTPTRLVYYDASALGQRWFLSERASFQVGFANSLHNISRGVLDELLVCASVALQYFRLVPDHSRSQ